MSDNKDPERVASGLLATMHNPKTSQEAKDRAEQRLTDMGAYDDEDFEDEEVGGTRKPRTSARTAIDDTDDQEHVNRQLGGYKATIHNPNTSDEAKAKASNVLKEHGIDM